MNSVILLELQMYHILMQKQSKFDFILVCKILTDGAVGLKLGRNVELATLHLHPKFEISRSFISENIPVEILFL